MKAVSLAVTVMGLHSVVLEDGVAYAMFDTADVTGDCGLLLFDFQLPDAVSREDLSLFAQWLAAPDYGETLH